MISLVKVWLRVYVVPTINSGSDHKMVGKCYAELYPSPYIYIFIVLYEILCFPFNFFFHRQEFS